MKFVNAGFAVILTLSLVGTSAWGQTGESGTAEKNAAAKQTVYDPHPDTRPEQTIYLNNIATQNDANEIVVAVRNLLDPSVKIYIVPSQNAIVMRGSQEQLALAQKVINDLDRPKKTYRLTYTFTETEGGKRIGVQHYSMVVTMGQRVLMKQGSRVPISTGSYNNASSQAQTQVTYLDIGMTFDATLDSYANGGRLRTKVEQSGVAEERSGVGPQDPVVRSTSVEGTSFLATGKPLVLGSLDIPGSTRHMDVDVVMEPIGQ